MKKLLFVLAFFLVGACSASAATIVTVKAVCSNPYTDKVVFEGTFVGERLSTPSFLDRVTRIYTTSDTYRNYIEISATYPCVVQVSEDEKPQ
jgi:hypothetical protein